MLDRNPGPVTLTILPKSIPLNPITNPTPLNSITNPTPLNPIINPTPLNPITIPTPLNSILNPTPLNPITNPNRIVNQGPITSQSPVVSILDPIPNPNISGNIWSNGNIIRLKSNVTNKYLGVSNAYTTSNQLVSLLDSSKNINDPSVFWTVVATNNPTSYLLYNNSQGNYLGNMQGLEFSNPTCNPPYYIVSNLPENLATSFTPILTNTNNSITISEINGTLIGCKNSSTVCYGYSYSNPTINNLFTVEYFK